MKALCAADLPATGTTAGSRSDREPSRIFIAALLAVLVVAGLSAAGAGEQAGSFLPVESLTKQQDVVRVRTAWSQDRARPGDRLLLAVIADIRDPFHINADANQVGSGGGFNPYPTRVHILHRTEGMYAASAVYPKAKPVRVAYAEDPLMLFSGRLVTVIPLVLEKDMAPGAARVTVELAFQACDAQTCRMPQKKRAEARIRIVGPTETVNPANTELFTGFRARAANVESPVVAFNVFGLRFSLDAASTAGVVLLMSVAAFGGMLLNFTPCVLPLVPIKIISLSAAADRDRHKSIALGLAMFLGVMVFWLLLGAAIALISGFTATNQLFQYPAFSISVGAIIAVMALGMFGLFHARLPGFIYMIHPDHESLPGSFAMGILTAVLSTPCTAPFMGAAAAWAATRPPAVTLATFAAIGTGMALPYPVLAARPGMVRKLPRSGPGSVLLKEVMGLFMLAAAAYFIGGGVSAAFSAPPDPPGKAYWWAVTVFCAAAGGWLSVRIFHVSAGRGVRAFFSFTGLLIICGGVIIGARLTDSGPVEWVAYTPARLEKAMSGGKTVVMVFTAEWCLNCKALEQGVLRDPRVVDLLSQADIVPMKADITGNNPSGKEKLKQTGSLTIPLLAVFSAQGETVFKSGFYTPGQVIAAVADARSSALE